MSFDVQAAKVRLLRILRQDIYDERVLNAIARVSRERFVPPALHERAYENAALPIAQGQSISQPSIVALMTQALSLQGGERVLELGTGSGYQSAVLAEMDAQVVSVERHPALAEAAAKRLAELGYKRVEVHVAPETLLGWPAGAPYDAIIVTAAAPMVPEALLSQLKDGGRLVLPVGSRDEQDLLLVTRQGERITRKNLGACRFVPLIGEGAWPESAFEP